MSLKKPLSVAPVHQGSKLPHISFDQHNIVKKEKRVGPVIFIWLIVELLQRKKPRKQRIKNAISWAFFINFLSFFGSQDLFPNGLAETSLKNWVALGISVALLVLYLAVLYGIRMLIGMVCDKFSKGKKDTQATVLSAAPNNDLNEETSNESAQVPGANPSNKFYLRDANTEVLRTPIHIHFDSYKPVLKMGNRTLDNPCTFLVTITSPELSPKGLTCYVSGINHKLTPTGVVDGVVAEVKMIKYSEEDDSLERVIVRLHEDGSVDGLVNREGKFVRITDLNGVYFMPSDSTYLDGMGNPFPPEQRPGNTKAQKALVEREQQEMSNSIMSR